MHTIRYAPALLLLVACTPRTPGETVASAGIAVRTQPVVAAALARPVTGTGVVAARDEYSLGFKIGGVVARVSVREGDLVRAGQLLAELDLREIDAAVAKARSGLAKTERDHARLQALWADSLAPLAQLQDAATAVELARADVQSAGINRRYATIMAPTAGRVLRRLGEAGQTVAVGAPVVVVGGSTGGTVVRVGLTDRDVVRIHEGDVASIQLDAFPGRTTTGRVRQLAGAATPGVGTYMVELMLDDARGLVSGMVAHVSIAARGRESLLTVPVEALVDADGERGNVFILSADGTHAQRRAVRVAFLSEGRAALRDGLSGDNKVVTDGAVYLTDGAKVKVQP
ncbi:MAG: efflux RND transporter periplasmic adaptor subunit [bacterium]